jgi:hypothetical protein
VYASALTDKKLWIIGNTVLEDTHTLFWNVQLGNIPLSRQLASAGFIIYCINAPMIFMAPYIIFWCVQIHYEGKWEGAWARIKNIMYGAV